MPDRNNEKEESKAFKVVDRRRFDLEGNTRADVPDAPRPEPVVAPPPPAHPAAAAPPPQAKGKAPAPPPPAAAAPDVGPDGEEMPGPGSGIDFLSFLQSLGQQALMQLGLVPYPDTGLVEPSPPLARQTIDILGMLAQKTRGNLTPKEAQFMEGLVYELRMAYVRVTEASMRQAVPKNLKNPPRK